MDINRSEFTSEFTSSNEITAKINNSDQFKLKGLSFLADNSFGDNLDNISPFKPEVNFTPTKSQINCLQLFPRLWSSSKRQLTPNPKLTPVLQLSPNKINIQAPNLTPILRQNEGTSTSTSSSNSQLITTRNIKQEEHIFEPKTPIPKKRAIQVVKQLLYEDRPAFYLVIFEQRFPTKVVTSQQWIQKGKARPYIVKLIGEFEQKLLEDKKLAEDLTEYEVEAILDRTLGTDIYLVRWVGWKEPTWEKRHYLLPKYESLLSQFDSVNDQQLPKGGEGIIINKNIRVVEAIKVISKLDRGNSGQPNSYLLEWPKNSTRVYTEGNEKIQSWEDKLSLVGFYKLKKLPRKKVYLSI
ncbi:unnamed protein product [Meloidogyne enterolobii]|uniref:Uncharacterized protein n=1 Tax=Meloidogyne enterolobii TaxID=390850 RepID=A0ACB1ADT9_MELEN